MTKVERVEMYRTFLADQGYAPEIHNDDNVVFMHQEHTIAITVDDHEEFFKMVMPNLWRIDGNAERRQVIRAAVEATRDTKVAKVYPVNDETWATVEMLCWPPESFKNVFESALMALSTGAGQFVTFMRQ